MKKSFKSTLLELDSAVWGLYFDVPKEVSDFFLNQNLKRFIFTFDSKTKVHRAFMHHGDGTCFIFVNKELMKTLGYPIGTEVEITVEPDESKYGMPMPEEFEEALIEYPKASDYFQALTPGKQRNLIYIVANPKRVETRVKKAIQIVEYLEHSGGKLDFKALHQWFKDTNNI